MVKRFFVPYVCDDASGIEYTTQAKSNGTGYDAKKGARTNGHP